MSTASRISRPLINALKPYASARRIGGTGSVWINANEAPNDNHLALSAEKLELGNLNRYPECQPPQLLKAYSSFCQLPEDNILITRGADEGIELLIRTFCEPNKDSIAFCPPTYGMYAISAETCGIHCNTLALNQQFETPFDELGRLDKQNKLLFLCHPNNPTGMLADTQSLEILLTQTQNRCLVVVDEAYIEFCPTYDVSKLIARYDNLIILRTLSKAFGLASLRCGFIMAHINVIQLLKKVIAPYPIPGPVAAIATHALSPEGIAIMRKRVSQINTEKQAFIKNISNLSNIEKVFESAANFVTIRFKNVSEVWQKLEEAGIIARAISQTNLLENCIRFSMGSSEEMQTVTTVLQNASNMDSAQQRTGGHLS